MKVNVEEIREKYKELFDCSLDFIYVSDLKGNFLDANDIALTTLGYDREELPKISFTNILDKEQLKTALGFVNEIKNKGKQTTYGEYKLKTKDGNFVYVETYGIPLRKEGKIFAILGIGNNITERKITELNLKESEERYRGLYEHTPFAILLIDSHGIIVDCNPTIYKLFGYKKSELIDKNFKDLSAIRPKDAPKLLDLFKQMINGEELHRIDFELVKKDGNLIMVNLQASLVTISEETFVQIILHEHKKSTILTQN